MRLTMPLGVAHDAIRVANEIKQGTWRDATHCEHGTYVGTWCGPDYLCGPCEDGTSPYVVGLYSAWLENRRQREELFTEAIKAMAPHFHLFTIDEIGSLVSTMTDVKKAA